MQPFPAAAITNPAVTHAGMISARPHRAEQARGKTVDNRSDIWAFGCVLYEMLTGRRAFSGETSQDTLTAVLTHEPDWSMLPAATPAGVVRLLHRCLAKDPVRRLHSVADARLEIEDADAPNPIAVFVKRARGALWPLAAVVAIAIGIAVWNSPRPPGPTPAATQTVRRLQIGRRHSACARRRASGDGRGITCDLLTEHRRM